MTIHDEIRAVRYFTHNLLVDRKVAPELAFELADRGYGFACAMVPAGPTMFHLSREAAGWVTVWSTMAHPYELVEGLDRPPHDFRLDIESPYDETFARCATCGHPQDQHEQ